MRPLSYSIRRLNAAVSLSFGQYILQLERPRFSSVMIGIHWVEPKTIAVIDTVSGRTDAAWFPGSAREVALAQSCGLLLPPLPQLRPVRHVSTRTVAWIGTTRGAAFKLRDLDVGGSSCIRDALLVMFGAILLATLLRLLATLFEKLVCHSQKLSLVLATALVVVIVEATIWLFGTRIRRPWPLRWPTLKIRSKKSPALAQHERAITSSPSSAADNHAVPRGRERRQLWLSGGSLLSRISEFGEQIS